LAQLCEFWSDLYVFGRLDCSINAVLGFPADRLAP
jgi:hypothetical protein